MSKYECVVVGASSGGLQALFVILGALPEDFSLPILVAQHLPPRSDSSLAAALDARIGLRVVEAEDKAVLCAGEVYVAVPDYHLTVERESDGSSPRHCVGLSQEPLDCFSRPAINVLFETAAVSTGGHLVGVILTGANDDGARGAACLKRWGGKLLVQDPRTAEYGVMPRAAIAATVPDFIGTVTEIGAYLCNLGATNERRS